MPAKEGERHQAVMGTALISTVIYSSLTVYPLAWKVHKLASSQNFNENARYARSFNARQNGFPDMSFM